MKALTIRQPHATLVAIGVKTIITRSKPAPQALIGQRIAIHAGLRPLGNGALYIGNSSDIGWSPSIRRRSGEPGCSKCC